MLVNTYDKDGNILSIRRYGNNNSLLDNFDYEYYSNTNRLKNLRRDNSEQFTYDYNGNMIGDGLANNSELTYDFRNLMLHLRNNSSEEINYYYDEAGNRVVKSTPNGSEYYITSADGKVIAIYEGQNLRQFNVYGNDLAGKINPDLSRYYYLKDHLGSIRAMLDDNETIVSAQDYDAWGYLLKDRTYKSDGSIYKFTGKERDNESTYDYFGARYYDSRVGRWGESVPFLSLSLYSPSEPVLVGY